jgi:hypothetical protein
MSGLRSYGDPCGIARALDLVEERWAREGFGRVSGCRTSNIVTVQHQMGMSRQASWLARRCAAGDSGGCGDAGYTDSCHGHSRCSATMSERIHAMIWRACARAFGAAGSVRVQVGGGKGVLEVLDIASDSVNQGRRTSAWSATTIRRSTSRSCIRRRRECPASRRRAWY